MSSKEMVTCKECKHWKRNTSADDHPSFGSCNSGKFKYIKEDLSEYDYDLEEMVYKDIEKDILMYYDSECYAAGCQTGEDFGCIHGELK